MSECSRCGTVESESLPLYEMEIQLTGEYWMMCEPCIEKFTEWLSAGTEHHSESASRTNSEDDA